MHLTSSDLDEETITCFIGYWTPFLQESKALFAGKKKITDTDSGRWRELLYCILAGSQFPVPRLKAFFQRFWDENQEILKLGSNEPTAAAREKTATCLKAFGYRYHTQKANTIQNALEFFNVAWNGQVSAFLASEKSAPALRKTITRDVKGIGIKIASHWLRNIGYDVCAIDVHLRRLFWKHRLTEIHPDEALPESEFLRLEGLLRSMSVWGGVPLPVAQFALWEYAKIESANRTWLKRVRSR